MIKSEFVDKDQDWHDESTTYWFLLDGSASGESFDNETIGIVDCGPIPPIVIEADDGALIDGRRREVVLRECPIW